MNITLMYIKIKLLLFFTAVLFYFNGCKKEITQIVSLSSLEKIQSARTFFEKYSSNRKLTLRSSKNYETLIKYNPKWENSSSTIIDGHGVVSVPVISNFSSISKQDVKFNLLVVDNGVHFETRTASLKFLQEKQKKQPKALSTEQLYDLTYSNKDLSNELPKYSEINIFNEHFEIRQITYYSPSGKNIASRDIPLPRNGRVDWNHVYTQYDKNSSLIDYRIESAYSDYPIESGAGGSGNEPPINPLEIINKVKDSCLKKMVDTVLSGNVKNKIALLIDSVFGGKESPDLIIKDTVGLPSNQDGQSSFITSPTGEFVAAEFTLNRTVLSKASTQFVTATILHEAVHAYMSKDRIFFDEAHNNMVTKYFNVMTNILRSMYPSLSLSHAKSLAWGGLEGTSYYSNPPSGLSVPLNQNEVNNDYRDGLKGTKCTKKINLKT